MLLIMRRPTSLRRRPHRMGAEALSLLDPGALSEAGRVDLLVAIERQLGWLHALLAELSALGRARTSRSADNVGRNQSRERPARGLKCPR